MSVRRVVLGIFIAAVVLPSTVLADELVKFVDGRYLKIASHKEFDTALRLSIGSRGMIVVPASRVETIERDGAVVYRAPAPRKETARENPVPAEGEVRFARGRGLNSRGSGTGDRPTPGPLLASTGSEAATERR
jgi:hypothetical protein